MNRRLARLVGVLALTTLFAASAPAPDLHVIKKLPVAGDGGWDYLSFDSGGHRLYISRGTRVLVVDVEKGAQVGEVPNTPGVHGIALAPGLNRGFTSNGRANTVTPFDLTTLATDKPIGVGKGPDAIIFDPATKRVFTFNGGGNDTTAIDAASEKVVGSVDLGGRPEFAVADGRGHVYCNIEDKSEIVQLDARALKVLNRWSLAPGDGPSGLAMDTRHRRLFSTCGNKMMVVMDADNGHVIATPAIGDGTDAAGFDPGTGMAFSSNGDGTLTVVHEKDPNTFEVVENVTTESGARTMALDPKTHTIYLCTAKVDPNPPANGQQRRFRAYLPGSFEVLVVGR